MRKESIAGIERLRATSAVLQRARLADPYRGMWEAADVQWSWSRPRTTDDLALPVWFDDAGPVAAAGLTGTDHGWQVDVFAVPSLVTEEEVLNATLEAAARHHDGSLEMLVREDDGSIIDLALRNGFTMTDELSGTTWMSADRCPPIELVEGFEVVDRSSGPVTSHPMIPRNGDGVEERLRQCSLYDPTLDLAVVDGHGEVAGYSLYWFDDTTKVGLLEPMRVHDRYQRRGLGRMMLTTGFNRLVGKGARRLKVGFSGEPGRGLYLGAGFVQMSVDRLLTRSARGPSI